VSLAAKKYIMDTYAQALLNFHKGEKPDVYEIVRDDGYSSLVSVFQFFDDKNFSEIESLALLNCNKKVLDIGAGVGRHSSELQRRGFDVTALDISEQAVEIMKERGIKKTICNDVMAVRGSKYDTLLMLMNGIGMVGTPKKLDDFLFNARELLNDRGILIVDSIDVFETINPKQKHIKYREKNISNLLYPGQQTMRIDYNGSTGNWFKWLHLQFGELSNHAEKNNFSSELLKMDTNGHYLAKLQKCS
jgi:2-polyprenyl-3-methyl-5-hydroxy-6-metoxy-1,4-benzoquinol methylase